MLYTVQFKNFAILYSLQTVQLVRFTKCTASTVYKLCCTLQFTNCAVHCTVNKLLYTVQFTNCAAHCPVYKLCCTPQFTKCAVQYDFQTAVHCRVYKLFWTNYDLQTVLYTVQVTNVLGTVQLTNCAVYYTVHTVHYRSQTVPHAVQFTNCAVHCTVYKLFCTLQFTNCAVHYGLQFTEHWTIYKLCCTLYGLQIVLFTQRRYFVQNPIINYGLFF